MRGWVAVAVLLAASGCVRGRGADEVAREPYVVVWASDVDRQHPDFLAVLDADPESRTYGRVLKTYPVKSRGNAAEGLLSRADGRVFAAGVQTNRVFTLDLRRPLEGGLADVDEFGPRRRFWAPHDFVSLPNGHVLVTCSDPARYRGDPRELLAAPGGFVELEADGDFVRELPAADPAARHLIIAPHGVAASAGRMVTTNTAKGYAATARGERAPGISVQVWKYPQLGLVKTVVLEAGPRGEENLEPLTPRFLRGQLVVLVNTRQGGALYVSDSVDIAEPTFKLAHDFGVGAVPGGAAVSPDDHWYLVALGGTSRVVSLDVRDPWHPKRVSSVRLDQDPLKPERARRGGPRGLALAADGTRVAVSNPGVDVPGIRRDGDHRVYVLRLDPATGGLRIDGAFRDETTQEVGVSFDREAWPHGRTGAARPAALAFLAPAPPED